MFRMLLEESSRLIFGASRRGGLGQEGQRSKKKHKQAKYQFSEQTSSPSAVNGKGLEKLFSFVFKSGFLCVWSVERVFISRGIGTEMENSPYPILAKSFTPIRMNTLTCLNLLQHQTKATALADCSKTQCSA